MELIEANYTKFRVFVGEKAPPSPLITVFLQVPINTFLSYCYQHLRLKTKKKAIIAAIFEKLGLNQKDFVPEDLHKFKRFIDYFLKASAIVGDIQ